jgi:hypothetical protein
MTDRVLKTARGIQEARARGEITNERTGVVVNAPIVLWPMGRR